MSERERKVRALREQKNMVGEEQKAEAVSREAETIQQDTGTVPQGAEIIEQDTETMPQETVITSRDGEGSQPKAESARGEETEVETAQDGDYQEAVRLTREKVMIHELINFDKEPEQPVKVSIVVPVCNVEQYLRECLDSCVNQTLKEIEIICVNDGSTDGCLDILKEYAEADERVKVISKDNAGYGHTMNLGMDMARGEYIGIVESDDFVKLEMYEALYNIAKEENIDIVKADFYRFTNINGYQHLFYNVLTTNRSLYNHILTSKDNLDMFKFTNTWTGIYKRSFLIRYQIRHQETPGASYQDNGFWFQTTVSASSIYYLEKAFYMNRRDNPNSSAFQIDKAYMINKEYAFIESFLDNNPDLQEKYVFYFEVKKFDAYYFNYRRIAPELKRDYVTSFSDEFKRALERGRIKPELFSSGNYRLLCELTNTPDEFYEKTKDNTNISYKLDMERKVPIVFICDDGYVIPTATAIASLLKFKKSNTKYDISLIAVNMSDDNIKKFSLIKHADVNINIIYIQENLFKNLHSSEITKYGVSATALIKFLLPDIMVDYEKLIYLDGDIIVKRDLNDLYQTELGDNFAGVVRDIPQVLYSRQIFGAKYGRNYFNSGVMVLNIYKMNEENLVNRLIETKKSLDSRLMDQDVFNEVFADRVIQLPIKYNTLYVNLMRSKDKYQLNQINNLYGCKYTTLEGVRRDSAIIHYCSKDKPWKYYDVPLADIWIEHFLRSSYGSLKIIRRSVGKNEIVECNGNIEIASDNIQELVCPIVFYYSTDNINATRVIVDNLAYIKKNSLEDERFDIYILFESEIPPKAYINIFSSHRIRIFYVDISNMLLRDSEYSKNRRLHKNYYRMLVPEILCQYNRILIIDGAIAKHDFSRYIMECVTSGGISFLHGNIFSFWNSPIVIIDVKDFICNITKFKFFDSYNDKEKGNFRYSKSFEDVISQDMSGKIDRYFWDVIEQESNSVGQEREIEGIINQLILSQNKVLSENRQMISEMNKKYGALLEEYERNLEESREREREVEQLRYELMATRNSFSCRLGLALTAIPRKMLRRN